MKKVLIVLGVLAAIGIYRMGVFKETPMRPISSVIDGDPCEERQFCVVAYMAPWCPHCRNAVPALQSFARKSSDPKFPGLKVWVGAGEPDANREMAKAFGPHGFVDADETVARKFEVRGFPSFYVLDRDGDIILRDAEAYQWVHEKL